MKDNRAASETEISSLKMLEDILRISQCQGDQGGKVHKGHGRGAQMKSAKHTRGFREMFEPLDVVIRYPVTCTILFYIEWSKRKPDFRRQ